MTWNVKQHTIISDLDGTLVNLLEELQLYLWHRFHIWVPVDVFTQYDAHEQIFEHLCRHVDTTGTCANGLPSTEKGLRSLLRRQFWFEPTRYFDARPYYPYWRALVSWRQRKGQLWFLTARHPALAKPTRLWLEQWGLENCLIYHTGNKYMELKELLSKMRGRDKYIFIEDRAEDIIRAQEDPKLAKKLRCILVDAPWNRWAQVGSARRTRNEIVEMLR